MPLSVSVVSLCNRQNDLSLSLYLYLYSEREDRKWAWFTLEATLNLELNKVL